MESTPPAGWYPDSQAGAMRYWDGSAWTEHFAQPTVVPAPVATTGTSVPLSPAGKVGLVGGAAALIGSFLPWASVTTFIGNIDIAGTTGDGVLTAFGAGLALLLGYLGLVRGAEGRGRVTAAVVFSVIGLAIATYDAVNLSNIVNDSSSDYARASVGYGLYLCVGGFAVSVLALWSARKS